MQLSCWQVMRIRSRSYCQAPKDAGLFVRINENNCKNLLRREDNFPFSQFPPLPISLQPRSKHS